MTQQVTRSQRPLYREIASILQAIRNCKASGNGEWEERHGERLAKLCRDWLPSGSGIDNGTRLEDEACRADKLVFTTSFHHMNDVGMYDGWTEHVVTVTPSFDGIELHIRGRDRNQIKEYLHEVFYHALTQEVPVE